MSDLTEFLLSRIAEDEVVARQVADDGHEPAKGWEAVAHHDPAYQVTGFCISSARALRECEAKREIVEAHRKWPVLITTPPKLETSDSADTMSVTMRMTQQIEWRTQEEYRTKFGDEPPTAPMIRALAMIYQDHPDFRDEWR